MTLAAAYTPGRFGLSFELFPPKTLQGDTNLMKHVAELVQFRPHLITCTYGAGGSTRHKTLDIVTRVRERFGCQVASHLTCVGSTVAELRAYLEEAKRRGIENIVALRGDPPKGQKQFQPVDGGLSYASQLVTLIRGSYPQFGIVVAGYPETHREAPSADVDLENLCHKVECGADVVVTQLFYNNDDFFRFRDRCASAGIRVPIVPGLLPVTDLAQIQRITSLCGATLPRSFIESLSAEADNSQGQFEVGVEFATRQTRQLIVAGVPGIHFYVLNKSQATTRVLRNVDIPQ